MTRTRRFRRTMACGHALYVTTVTGDPPQDEGSLLCRTCGDFQPITETVEVPAMEPILSCPECRSNAPVVSVENADTDHPTVKYRCPNGHFRTVQL